MKFRISVCKKVLSFAFDMAEVVSSLTPSDIDDVAVRAAASSLRKLFNISKPEG